MGNRFFRYALWLLLPLAVQAAPSVDYIRRHAVPLSNGGPLPQAVYRLVRNHKVLAIGEIHGTNEAPRFTARLVRLLRKHRRSVLLALEVPTTAQGSIERYFETGDLSFLKDDPFFSRPYQDGRSSRAMVALLDEVRALEKVSVLCFDPTDALGGQDRDEKMARNIAAAYQSGSFDTVVILAGNLHTSLSQGNPFDPAYRPMAYQLIHGRGAVFEESELLPIRVRNQRGLAWCCLGPTPRDCQEHPMNFAESSYTKAVPHSEYFLAEKETNDGHRATFFTRALSASPPLMSPSALEAVP